MDPNALDQAAQRIYETLAAAGHGPRPWAPFGGNAPAWEQLSDTFRAEYRAAAVAAAAALRAADDPGRGVMAL
jgi:hypothetical protein